MRKKILLVLFTALIGFNVESQAGFLIKKVSPIATNGEQQANTESPSVAQPEAPAAVSATSDAKITKKQSFFRKMFSPAGHEKKSIAKWLYIVLSVFWLGWLAMGLNSGWKGFPWILSLILYCVFWLPGLIYSLIKMHTYYGKK